MDSPYKKEIFELAKSHKQQLFYNSSAEHAAIVHQAIMCYAQNYVNIFSSALCTEISNNKDYCEMTEQFLMRNPNHKIDIVLTDYSKEYESYPIYKVLRKYPMQVRIRTYKGKAMLDGKKIHFTVSDDRAFRVETDIDEHMAFGNFNSPTQANNLKEAFSKVFNQSEVCLPS